MTERPWETAAAAPWLTAQPLYDRVISVRRLVKPAAVGALPYSGTVPKNEAVIFSGLAASIQFQPRRDRPLATVPTDAVSVAQWHIYLAAGLAAAGQIVERDVIADDLGRRFEVFASWPTSLGWVFAVQLLEA